jgi:hypothetical protein
MVDCIDKGCRNMVAAAVADFRNIDQNYAGFGNYCKMAAGCTLA